MVTVSLLRAVERLDRFLVFSRLFFQCLAYRLSPPQLPVFRADEGSPRQRDKTDNCRKQLDDREHQALPTGVSVTKRRPRLAIVITSGANQGYAGSASAQLKPMTTVSTAAARLNARVRQPFIFISPCLESIYRR